MGLILNYWLERGLEGLQELDESIDLSPVTEYVEPFQDYRFHEGEVVELESGETYRITDRLPGLTAIRDENVYRGERLSENPDGVLTTSYEEDRFAEGDIII